MNNLKTFMLCTVAIALTSATPQFGGGFMPNPGNSQNQGNFPNQWDSFFQQPTQNQNQPNGNQPLTTQAPNAQITNLPAFINCVQNQCPTTSETNPVCGSDQVTYGNDRKLGCANMCGERLAGSNWQEITQVRRGSCTSGQRVA